MDVGQITGATSSPTRRDPETRDEGYDGFSNYLEDQAPAKDTPVKTASAPESAPQEPVVQPVAEDNVAQDVAPDAAPTDASSDKTETAVDGLAKEAPPAAPIASAQTVTTQLQPASATANHATDPLLVPTGTAGPASNAGPDPKLTPAAQSAVEKPVTGNPAQSNASAQLNNSAGNQVVAPAAAQATAPVKKTDTTSDGKKDTIAATPNTDSTLKPAPADSLEKIRMDAAGRLTEKDILSNKIAELLQDSKGKISLAAATPAKSFQATLASSTNLVTAASADASPATFGMAVQAAARNAEIPFGQILTTAAQIPATPGEATQSLAPPPAAAAVQGVDATAINSASQANNAARIAGQTPVAEQVSLQLSHAAKEGADRIKISLHPSELGRVDVKLEIGQDGRVIAAIAVDKQETLDLLQRDARSLEKALQDAGFETGSGSLNFSLNQDGQDEPSGFADGETILPQLLEDADLSPIAPSQMATDGIGNGNLDIQV